MRKHIVEWSILLLSLSLLRIIAPSVLFSFAGMEFPFAVIGSIVGLSAVIFTSPAWENVDFRPLFRLGAVVSFMLFAVCLFSPTFGSIRHTYVSFLDLFVLLESSVILGLASMETKKEALSVFAAVPLTLQLMIRRFRESDETRPRLRGAH